jgi:uncharacterized repeat protein (TIGR01451 family)
MVFSIFIQKSPGQRMPKRDQFSSSIRRCIIKTVGFVTAILPAIAAALPVPDITITSTSAPLLNSPVTIDLSFANTSATSSDIGYYPVTEVRLPSALISSLCTPGVINTGGSCSGTISTTVPNAATATFVGFRAGSSSTTYINPLTLESISLAAFESYFVITSPLGTLSVGQPAVQFSIPAALTSNAALGTPYSISGRGVFLLGDIPNGTKRVCGTLTAGGTLCETTNTITGTPSVVRLTKSTTPQVAAATGPNYPRDFLIAADISNGATVTNLVLTDTIPDEFVVSGGQPECSSFLDVTPNSGFTCSTTMDPNGGGTFTVTFATATGTASSSDITVAYSGYVQEFVDANPATPVISATTGDATTSQNTAQANFSYLTVAQPQQTASATISQRSLTVTKSGSIISDVAPTSVTQPGDRIQWTYTIHASDYFDFENLVFHDDLQDGQSYVSGSMVISVQEGGTTYTINEGDLLSPPAATKNGTTGITTLDVDISAELDRLNSGAEDNKLTGARRIGPSVSASRIIITYRTDIDESLTASVGAGRTQIINGGDVIRNLADLDADVVGGGSEDLANTQASITVSNITSSTKVVAFVNGSTPGSFPPQVRAGDTVTYRIDVTIPSGDVENFRLKDFLPSPVFRATDPDFNSGTGTTTLTKIADGDTAPDPGEWRYRLTTSADILALTPTLSSSTNDNSVTFDFADTVESGASSTTLTLSLLFTVTATSDAYAQGLILANSVFVSHAASQSDADVVQVSSIANIETLSPNLVIAKLEDGRVGAGSATSSSGNFIGAAHGDLLEFGITVQNNGGRTAEDVTVTDTLPSGLIRPTTGADPTHYNFSISGAGCSGFSSASTASKFELTGGTITAGSTCSILVQMGVDSPARYGDVLTNTATTTYRSSIGGQLFPPESESATVTMANPTIDKTGPTNTDDNETSGSTLRGGEESDFALSFTLPPGEASNFRVREVDSGTGAPSGGYFLTIADADVTFTAATEQNCISGSAPYNTYFNFVGNRNVCFASDPTAAANITQTTATELNVSFGVIRNFATSDQTFTVTVRTRLDGTVADGTYSNTGRLVFDRTSGSGTITDTQSFTVDNPGLTITKTTSTSAPVGIGDTIRYSVAVQNTGTSSVYSVTDLLDTLPTGLINPVLVSANYDGASRTPTISVASGVASIPVLGVGGAATLAAGKTYTVVYDVTFDGTRVADTDNSAFGVHPGGVVNPAGFISSIANSADIASFRTGPLGDDPQITAITASSVSLTVDSDKDGILNSVEGNVDRDGDGVPNYLDTDSDDNGVTESSGGAVDGPAGDRDGDGILNYQDPDDDGDSIRDREEILSAPTATVTGDSDGDGIPNFRDADSDNDGITDSAEGSGDFDGDGFPNYIDVDADNDGIVDLVEAGGVDSDGDGRADTATDTDSDGIVNTYDSAPSNINVFTSTLTPPNTDSSGSADYLDIDSDGDGITDLIEAQTTTGLRAPTGVDANGNGLDDGYQGVTDRLVPINTDGDTTPDYRDSDSDGDGRADLIEGHDGNSNGAADRAPAGADTDGDGLDNTFDTFNLLSPPGSGSNATGTNADLQDTDSDTRRDWRDIDDDNDGIPTQSEETTDRDSDGISGYLDLDSDGDTLRDIVEAGGVDSNSDGRVDSATDTDGDGLANTVDVSNGGSPLPLTNTDASGATNFLDRDSDDDGIPDATEGGLDLDGDGKPNYLDVDSDNDGIVDLVEAGGVDANGDGRADTATDTDGDGLADLYDSAPSNAAVSTTTLSIPNTDGSGFADYLDIDADGDGIPDIVEAQTTTAYTSPSGTDANGNGLDDQFQGSSNRLVPVDTDSDGTPDYRDSDSDGDGIVDLIEGHDANSNSVADRVPAGADTDGDGLDDSFDTFNLSTPPGSGYNATGSNAPVQDSDGDGRRDWRDVDDDNDGIPTSTESATDTDNDGTKNYLDLDSDGDGIRDIVEGGGSDTNGDGRIDVFVDSDNDGLADSVDPNNGGTPLGLPDTNGNTIPDYIDPDTDADGIPDTIEGSGDFDGDGIPNFRDLDSDNDAILDSFETARDTDGDGHSDYLDLDSDNDGVPDSTELTTDPDGDGLPNYRDLDSDGDSLFDITEGGGVDSNSDGKLDNFADSDSDGLGNTVDTSTGGVSLPLPNSDGNGRANLYDVDSDDDGIPDSIEGLTDTDLDTVPNYLDLDSDNDGVPDLVEAGGVDTDGNGRADVSTDTDNDGLVDSYDTSPSSAASFTTLLPIPNTDGASGADYIDTDSDGDSLSDLIESGGVDTNSDGIVDSFADSDGDGLSNSVDTSTGGTKLPRPNTDTTGKVNSLDLDSDDDGIPDATEGASDFDRDGIPNYLDLDSDNDGIVDLVEAGGVDTNGTGRADSATDTDSDGLVDLYDSAPTNALVGTTTLSIPNTDSNGSADYLDIDADGDGITDTVEAQTTAGLRSPSGADANSNGIDDQFEGALSRLSPVDTDGDGTPDYRDLDTDGDSIPDTTEGHDGNSNSVPDRTALGTDQDGDGLDDAFDTFNRLSPPASGHNATGSNAPIQDTDGDTVRDWRDIDDDNDAIPTATEGASDPDQDGRGNYLDLDSDGDTIFDIVEAGGGDSDGNGQADSATDSNKNGLPDTVDPASGGSPLVNPDTDGDGTPNRTDPDSDGDTIPDSTEGTTDTDRDGIPNYLDLDSDNDGIPDSTEGTRDSDLDGIPDRLDLDSDSDGIPDILEAGGTDANGDGRSDVVTDSDKDGWPDTYDTSIAGAISLVSPLDTDSDGRPDFRDIDADGDGIVDIIEGQATDTLKLGVGTDSDGDGIDNVFDIDSGGLIVRPIDTDNDGTPDFRSQDSDGDRVPDRIEGHDANHDGKADATPQGTDTDGDGLDDAFDTINLTASPASNSGGTNAPLQDTDSDGKRDWRDTDDDGDGILTVVEDTNDNDIYTDDDFDNDGIPNYLEPNPIEDTDTDGRRDDDEEKLGLAPCDPDSDQDGLIDGEELVRGEDGYLTDPLDADTDDDGLSDGAERDFAINPLNTDSDSDGISDGVEAGIVEPIPDGVNECLGIKFKGTSASIFVPDSCPSTVSNPASADSDNDGLIDGEEDKNQNGCIETGETNPGDTVVSPSCSRLELDPIRFNVDGDAEKLKHLVQVAAHARQLASRRSSCAAAKPKFVKSAEQTAASAYLRVWESMWGAIPRATYTCAVIPSGACYEFATTTVKSDVSALTSQLSSTVSKVLGPCRAATRATRKIEQKRKALTRSIATQLQSLPETTAVCP